MRNKELTPLRKQKMCIIAQDPGVQLNGRILTTQVTVPAEELADGPWGHRVQVIDYDVSTQTLYKPHTYQQTEHGVLEDPFENADDQTLLNDPRFHEQNVYAIVMRTLARFEYALGRRVSWGFDRHQLKVAPHAFADANAFYSKEDEALVFGYFVGANKQTVYTCLSHDIVAHETTHALLDGLRDRYTDPSSPDQAGFHEGFADVVALLSVFALPDIVRMIIDKRWQEKNKGSGGKNKPRNSLISIKALSVAALRESLIFGLAEEMGKELAQVRGQALRESAKLTPSPKYYQEDEEFLEPHRRGEILVAAMLNAFLQVWVKRMKGLDPRKTGLLDRDRVSEEGAQIADRLLTMSIRALDYCPPVHVEFGDFLSALLTADYEIHPDDSRYDFRRVLCSSFSGYGIKPASRGTAAEPGLWLPPESEGRHLKLNYSRTHFESLRSNPEEVFCFLWENRRALALEETAFMYVRSVRPCLRIAEDGFALQETIAEYEQILTLTVGEIRARGIPLEGLADNDQEIKLYGGGVLVFDEYGRLKFHIHNSLSNFNRQKKRLQAMVESGRFDKGWSVRGRFSNLHLKRALKLPVYRREGWI